MKSNQIILLFLLLSFGCKPKNQNECIDLAIENSISVFDVFSDVKVVKLETIEESLIGLIYRADFYNDRYYLLDVQSQQLFCFDETGSFKFKVSSQGAGLGEYHYITDFSIDKFNERLILLDPVMQRVLFFDLDGNYLVTQALITEKVMGFNKVFALNDSILLVTSITYDQLVFFNLNQNRVIQKAFEFPVNGTLQAFYPTFNVYQLNNRTYALPALSQELFDITDLKPVPYFRWCFGVADNSIKQVSNLIEEIRRREGQHEFYFHHQAVGKGKILNQFILKIYESNRYKIAILEYSENYFHAFIDNFSGKSFVFKTFIEGVSLLAANVSEDYVIAYETGHSEYFKNSGIPELVNRRVDYFCHETLSETDRQIIENHNPMTDNPFLVVYKFRE